MQVGIKIDSNSILKQLKELGEDRQGPFILSKTLNLLAKSIQEAERQDFKASLVLRRSSWVTGQVKIMPGKWSSKRKLVVRIETSDAASFLSKLDSGGDRVPILGRKYLAFPNPKVFGKKIIGREDELRVKNLNLHETPHGLRGEKRTFMIKNAKGTPLIMQRVEADERGKVARKAKTLQYMSGLRLLYTLVKTVHIPKKIHWFEVANSTVINNQASIARDVMRDALADTKKK